MTKNDIALGLCKRIPGIAKTTALQIVDTFADILSESFIKGEDVTLRNFGVLEVRTSKERKARIVNTGEQIIIPARRTVKFRISKHLQNRMNDGTVD